MQLAMPVQAIQVCSIFYTNRPLPDLIRVLNVSEQRGKVRATWLTRQRDGALNVNAGAPKTFIIIDATNLGGHWDHERPVIQSGQQLTQHRTRRLSCEFERQINQ